MITSHGLLTLGATILVAAGAFGAAPELRDQVSLNGNWPTGGNVPRYDSQNVAFDNKTYERTFTVPSGWSGKRIKLEFNAVNWYCDVYLNGQKIGSHNGAWVPFEFDITGLVQAGKTYTLRLDVRGEMVSPTRENGKVMWWIGYNDLDKKRAGIVDDVWLRAYGQVHIEDAFIKTSYRNGQINVEYTVVNRSSSRWTGRAIGDVTPDAGGGTVKTVQTGDFSLDPGQRKTVTASAGWSNAQLWWPDRPNLYLLKSRLASGSSVADRETRRFGFREFWIEGNQFRLNGTRINIRGDWSCFTQYWGNITDEVTLEGHYNAMRKTNANMLRWHKHPAPRFAYELADEMGIMVMAESAMYGRPFYDHDQKVQLIDNCLTLIPSWIKGSRNHACIMIWSACNEATYAGLSHIPADQLKRLGDKIYEYDNTRPVNYDGDSSVPGVMVNRHYIEGYEKNPTDKFPNGDMYNDWTKFNDANRPTYLGEILAVRPGANDNAWWIGVWPRGLRHANFAGIAPRVYYAGTRITSAQADLQAKAYAPIALFDIAYDKLGIKPYQDGSLPILDEGTSLKRDVVVYNDDYQDTSVMVETELRVNGTSYAKGRSTFALALGEHHDFKAGFQVPFKGNSVLEVIYRTYKGGVKRFEEVKKFNIRETGKSGTSSSVVTFDGTQPPPPPPPPVPTNQPPKVSITSPSNGTQFDNPANVTVTASASDPDGKVAKVDLYLNGAFVRTEYSAPYQWTFSSLGAGNYSLTAKAYDDKGATASASSVFAVVDPMEIASFTLINADTNQPVAGYDPVADGAVLNVLILPTKNLNLRANTRPATVGSVRFGLDGQSNYKVENGAPYALGPNNTSSYGSWSLGYGAHTVTATPFSGANASGTAGKAKTIQFTLTCEAKVNFQLAGAATPSGYQTDAGAAYGSRGGGYTFGWNTDNTVNMRARNLNSDQRRDTLAHMNHTNDQSSRTWELALPNGTYKVHLVCGDPAFTDQVNHLQVEGSTVRDPDGQDHYDEYNLTVVVSDGRLTLRPGSGAYNPKVCCVEVNGQ